MLKIEVGLADGTDKFVDTSSTKGLSYIKLSKASEVIFGGVPSGKKLPSDLKSKNYVGAIDHVKIDGVVKGLWNWEVGCNLVEPHENGHFGKLTIYLFHSTLQPGIYVFI